MRSQQVFKLLLLGAGESGKSTLYKQVIQIYGDGFQEEDRLQYTYVIFSNTIEAMQILIEQSEKFYWDEMQGGGFSAEESKELILSLDGEDEIDPLIANHITRLWDDPLIKETWHRRSEYSISDSASYFFEKVDEIADVDYIPSVQDVLRSRVRTTGIVDTSFIIDGNHFKIFDVGGQRNERKKWIHCFESVTAVLFVVALSGYNQILFEDTSQNKLQEALSLFDEICNSQWFKSTSMILFLNKRDLFEVAIQDTPLNVCFPEYTYDGPNQYEEGCMYIQYQFEQANRNPNKVIYTHITCATDSDNVQVVFNAVKDVVIRNNLQEAGLIY